VILVFGSRVVFLTKINQGHLTFLVIDDDLFGYLIICDSLSLETTFSYILNLQELVLSFGLHRFLSMQLVMMDLFQMAHILS
jgi:hypothetical protein